MNEKNTLPKLISNIEVHFREHAARLKEYHSAYEDVKKQNSALIEKNSHLDVALENINTNQGILQNEYDSLKNKYSSLLDKVNNLSADKNRLKSKVDQLYTQINSLNKEKQLLDDNFSLYTKKWQELGALYNSIQPQEKQNRLSLFKNKIIAHSLPSVITGIVTAITLFSVMEYIHPSYYLKTTNNSTSSFDGHDNLIQRYLHFIPNKPTIGILSEQVSNTDSNTLLTQRNKQLEEFLIVSETKDKECRSQLEKDNENYSKCKYTLDENEKKEKENKKKEEEKRKKERKGKENKKKEEEKREKEEKEKNNPPIITPND
ncbi:hypothetical protein HYX11_04630 [Candidatus Woesearchaeota archaeon]|nr:hypothetical protein [Candidatus Woesearchaeota archaeon]